jgi:hypothetical protein
MMADKAAPGSGGVGWAGVVTCGQSIGRRSGLIRQVKDERALTEKEKLGHLCLSLKEMRMARGEGRIDDGRGREVVEGQDQVK